MVEALERLQLGALVAEAQDETLTCYAAKLKKEEAKIDWSQSAQQIARQVAAFNPWPVAQSLWGDKVIRIWQADLIETISPQESNAGEVIAASKAGIDVCCGDGVLRITELQMPGKKRVDAASFVNAYPIVGECLS